MQPSTRRLAQHIRYRQPFAKEINTDLHKGRVFLTPESSPVFISYTPRDGEGDSNSNGFSIAVKDNIASSGGFTTCASGILREHRSPFEAHVLERLRKASVWIEGKTNLDEFGMGSHSTNSYFGRVRRFGCYTSVGGSSGGSAVAVATGKCEAALGTDTGGSVRLPAAYNSIVGFKPSYGRISRWGVVPYANSLDTVGILGRTVATVSRVFDFAKGHDCRDPTSLRDDIWPGPLTRKTPLSGIKIGIPREYNIEEVAPDVLEGWQVALEILRANGCELVPVSLPTTRHALSAYYVIAPAEAASNLSKYDGVRYGSRSVSSDGAGDSLYSQSRGEGFGDEVKRRILLGSYTLSSEAIDNYFIQAQKIRRLVQQDFNRVFSLPHPLHSLEQFDLGDMEESILLENKLGPSQVDFMICPTAPTPARNINTYFHGSPVRNYMNDVFTVPASLAGLPAISVPFIRQSIKQATTIGIQIIGQYSDDDQVLWIAAELERLQAEFSDWHKIRRLLRSKTWPVKSTLENVPVQGLETKADPPASPMVKTKIGTDSVGTYQVNVRKVAQKKGANNVKTDKVKLMKVDSLWLRKQEVGSSTVPIRKMGSLWVRKKEVRSTTVPARRAQLSSLRRVFNEVQNFVRRVESDRIRHLGAAEKFKRFRSLGFRSLLTPATKEDRPLLRKHFGVRMLKIRLSPVRLLLMKYWGRPVRNVLSESDIPLLRKYYSIRPVRYHLVSEKKLIGSILELLRIKKDLSREHRHPAPESLTENEVDFLLGSTLSSWSEIAAEKGKTISPDESLQEEKSDAPSAIYSIWNELARDAKNQEELEKAALEAADEDSDVSDSLKNRLPSWWKTSKGELGSHEASEAGKNEFADMDKEWVSAALEDAFSAWGNSGGDLGSFAGSKTRTEEFVRLNEELWGASNEGKDVLSSLDDSYSSWEITKAALGAPELPEKEREEFVRLDELLWRTPSDERDPRQ